jgi:hypothetical protein
MLILRGIACFVVDMALKFALGIGIVLGLWLVASLIFDTSIRPWLIGGAVFGALLNGFWEGCDIFGLRKVFGRDDQ